MTTPAILMTLHTSNTAKSEVAEESARRDEEEVWIEAAAGGDTRAFRKLYDRYFDYVVRVVGRVMGPGAGCEDVVQEVFVQVHRSLSRYRGDAKFSTWLYRVAYNIAVSHVRRRTPTVELDAWRPLRDASCAWGQLEARDLVRVLYAALEHVSPDHREAFLLHEVEGMKLREIAEMSGESINTIAARVRRTRERMRAILEQKQEEGRD